ncbi:MULTISPECIES: MFS transporter [unclassified Arsukibacterium]|uniref:MFS transporter n=1 Tax=unclassified Arsukibacterium TaxID=2635278 RepID=UPI000C3C30E1|nr:MULTISPECIES: MFS transporter [unclassified Arsukibacterium]MAA94584.1 MFS transporter [Rheinheimera sp.]MBM32833.1 MFS transporter [Rheinheimera sp.]HAW93348.1 MFS transporter [Candidatus Azambacteria bacterium]|tara:strand:+ start:10854 stop:12134 length:1281 start_codon:yes stop_codon:yes gene_type:complete
MAERKIYELLVNEEDARACRDIPDSACTRVPKNFVLVLLSQLLLSLGDLLTSPKTVLTWLMNVVGAPAAMVAWLVPIRESGSMLPQLLIGAWVRRYAIRKTFWIAGSIVQGSCVLAMALAVNYWTGAAAGSAIIGLLLVFSLGRGLCSVAMKDVKGKTVPKGQRGQLTGIAGTASGVLTLLVSLWLLREEPDNLLVYVVLLVAAAMLWLSAAVIFSQVQEQPGETDGGANALQRAWQNLGLLQTDKQFRQFVICRGLLLGSALVSPFLVLLAQQQHGNGQTLAWFLICTSLASALSAVFWGRLADRSSRQVMIIAATLALAGCAVLAAVQMVIGELPLYGYLLLFLLLSVGHAGVRVGRKTYLLDMASGNQRTDYVSVSNTIIGVLLLVVGGISSLLAWWSLVAVLWFFAASCLAGLLYAIKLPEA